MNPTHKSIVEQYMAEKYPNVNYTMRPGNNTIWVTKGMVDMYFIIRNDQIVDIQVD